MASSFTQKGYIPPETFCIILHQNVYFAEARSNIIIITGGDISFFLLNYHRVTRHPLREHCTLHELRECGYCRRGDADVHSSLQCTSHGYFSPLPSFIGHHSTCRDWLLSCLRRIILLKGCLGSSNGLVRLGSKPTHDPSGFVSGSMPMLSRYCPRAGFTQTADVTAIQSLYRCAFCGFRIAVILDRR